MLLRFSFVDAHRGWGGERGTSTSCIPQKTSKNLVIKCNKTLKIRTPLDFCTTPIPPSKEFENDCASLLMLQQSLFEMQVGKAKRKSKTV